MNSHRDQNIVRPNETISGSAFGDHRMCVLKFSRAVDDFDVIASKLVFLDMGFPSD